MIKRLIIILSFVFLFIITSSANNTIINKILYKKTLINDNQPVFVNIFLNHMNAKDVIAFFNNEEITNITKNLKPYIKDDKDFLPSFYFEVKNIKKTNFLKIFVILSQDITISAETKLYFNKGIIVDSDNFQISKNKIFFVKIGDFFENKIFYSIEIDEPDIIKKVGEIINEQVVYYKFKSLKKGSVILNIFRHDKLIEKQKKILLKIIKINIEN